MTVSSSRKNAARKSRLAFPRQPRHFQVHPRDLAAGAKFKRGDNPQAHQVLQKTADRRCQPALRYMMDELSVFCRNDRKMHGVASLRPLSCGSMEIRCQWYSLRPPRSSHSLFGPPRLQKASLPQVKKERLITRRKRRLTASH
jgi:hypothetical protein